MGKGDGGSTGGKLDTGVLVRLDLQAQHKELG
jgi:hypothetical protein